MSHCNVILDTGKYGQERMQSGNTIFLTDQRKNKHLILFTHHHGNHHSMTDVPRHIKKIQKNVLYIKHVQQQNTS
jgi:hypothetical protein